MRNSIALFVFVAMITISSSAQTSDSAFVGTWQLTKTHKNAKLPKSFTIDFIKDSLVVIPKNGDSLTFSRVMKYDSSTLILENFILDSKTETFSTFFIRFSLNEKGDKLKTAYKLDNSMQGLVIIEYSFQTECCSNHNPNDCADEAKELQKLKDKGCTGFRRPK